MTIITRAMSASLLAPVIILQLPVMVFADAEDPTAVEMKGRIAELKSPESDLPQSEFLIYSETQRTQDELAKYQHYLATLERPDDSLKRLQDIRTDAASVIKLAKALDCKMPKPGEVESIVAKVVKIRSRLVRIDEFDEDNPWNSIPTRVAPNEKPEQLCERVKQALAQEADLIGYFDKPQKTIADRQQEIANAKQLAIVLVEKLQLRRNALQAKAASLSNQAAVAKDLWLIISLMCGFSILTIFVIRLFPDLITKEWVESGQVIQFVTVMILLSVIMALGMSNVLKENTLGTLLGGLAGYVLSQGVGRATAQALTRGIAAATAKPSTLAITSVAPNSGPRAGGTQVTISGSGFLTGAKAAIGGVAANVTSVADGTVVVTTPAHVAGPADVVVTNLDGKSTTLPNGFTFT
jgi:hypothetical protein